MNNICKTIVLAVFVFLGNLLSLCAQQVSIPVAQGGFMRSSGKIYVVVAVVLVIQIGLLLYLVMIDRKISKLENNA